MVFREGRVSALLRAQRGFRQLVGTIPGQLLPAEVQGTQLVLRVRERPPEQPRKRGIHEDTHGPERDTYFPEDVARFETCRALPQVLRRVSSRNELTLKLGESVSRSLRKVPQLQHECPFDIHAPEKENQSRSLMPYLTILQKYFHLVYS